MRKRISITSDDDFAILAASSEALDETKQRNKPRSKLVEAIAVLLLARPMRASEIAQVVGKSTRYVSSYLSYWKTRGLFDYENGFWVLTPLGEEFARNILEREMNSRVAQYAALARQILSESLSETVKTTINNKKVSAEPDVSGQIQPFIAELTSNRSNKRQKKKPKKLCIRSILDDLELDEDERLVLETLMEHYIKWNMTYTYIDQLEKTLEADRAWLLTVLRSLQSKGLIYIYNDKRLGTRIGLSKNTKRLLALCSSI
jgi:AraC-like DNA-binding protein